MTGRQDMTSRQDRTGQGRAGQDRTGQDRTGQDRTGKNRMVTSLTCELSMQQEYRCQLHTNPETKLMRKYRRLNADINSKAAQHDEGQYSLV